METITIEQLDAGGRAWRQFTHHVATHELDGKLDRIRLAYNMDHTRVLINGVEEHRPMETSVRYICATCERHFDTARRLVEHVIAEGMCRSCGYRHDGGDCPRWPAS